MWEWLCSPHTCFMAGWLYDFQSLVSGVLATGAAIATVIVIRHQIVASNEATRLQIAAGRENLERELAHERALREEEQRRELERELENINRVLANEARDLSRCIRVIDRALSELDAAIKSTGANQQRPSLQAIGEAFQQLERQLQKAGDTVYSLSMDKTTLAHTALVLMDVDIRAIQDAIKIGDQDASRFDDAVSEVRLHRNLIERWIPLLQQQLPNKSTEGAE
jgi:hypothetical protein